MRFTTYPTRLTNATCHLSVLAPRETCQMTELSLTGHTILRGRWVQDYN